MFARFVTLLPLAALAAVATAAAPEARTAPTCNSGSVYCCNKTFSSPTDFAGILGGLLVSADVLLGLNCSPITVIGALSNGAQCTQQTACCKNVEQNGLVNVACTPINVSL